MKRGDLVCYHSNIKRFFVVLDVKKLYHGYKDRVRTLCPSSGGKHWFLKQDLEVLSESR